MKASWETSVKLAKYSTRFFTLKKRGKYRNWLEGLGVEFSLQKQSLIVCPNYHLYRFHFMSPIPMSWVKCRTYFCCRGVNQELIILQGSRSKPPCHFTSWGMCALLEGPFQLNVFNESIKPELFFLWDKYSLPLVVPLLPMPPEHRGAVAVLRKYLSCRCSWAMGVP